MVGFVVYAGCTLVISVWMLICGVCCFNNVVVFGSLYCGGWLDCFANGLRFDTCCLLSVLFGSLGWVFGVWECWLVMLLVVCGYQFV